MVKGFDESQENLIIFTDPGIDDAIAINEILEKAPSNVKIYLCPVAGNVDKELALANAKKLHTDRVSAVIDSREFDTTDVEMDPSYCGKDGLGDTEYYRDVQSERSHVPLSRAGFAIDYTLPTDIMILSPCTVPRDWLSMQFVNNMAGNIKNIYIMGGCEVIDNFNGYEFNQALNVEAFQNVLEALFILTDFNNTKVHIATLDSCESRALDMFNVDVDALDLPESTKQLFKAGKELAIKRGENKYFIYNLTIAWKYLEDKGVYPQQFIKRTHLLKGTNTTTSDIIVPYASFVNPWESRRLTCQH